MPLQVLLSHAAPDLTAAAGGQKLVSPMIARIAACLIISAAALFMAGCIHHEETVYRDVPRANVQFENDTAARVFYEALSRPAHKGERTESKTEVELPLVFSDKRRVVSGPNAAFNTAVEVCDANHDGRITEQEARIYAANRETAKQ